MTVLENQNQSEASTILDNETCRQFANIIETAINKEEIMQTIGNHVITQGNENMTIEQRAASGKLNILAAAPAALVSLYMQTLLEIAAPLSTNSALSNYMNQKYHSLTTNVISHNPAIDATLNGVPKKVERSIEIKDTGGSVIETFVVGTDHMVYQLNSSGGTHVLKEEPTILANANEIVIPTNQRTDLGIDNTNTSRGNPNHRNTRFQQIDQASSMNGFQKFTYMQTLINTHNSGLDFSDPQFKNALLLRDKYRKILFDAIREKFSNDNETGYFDKCDQLAYDGDFFAIVDILKQAKSEILYDRLRDTCKIDQTPFGKQSMITAEFFVDQQIAIGATYLSRAISNQTTFSKPEDFTNPRLIQVLKDIEPSGKGTIGILGDEFIIQAERAELKSYVSDKILEFAFQDSGIAWNKIRDGERVYKYNIVRGLFSSHGMMSKINNNNSFTISGNTFNTARLGEDRFAFQETFRFANLVHYLITTYPKGQRKKITLGTEQKDLTMRWADRPDFEAVNVDPMSANSNFADKKSMFRVYPSLKEMQYRENRETAINNAFYSSN